MNYRFYLDKIRPTKLFICPQCLKKALKRYWDGELNNYVNDNVGRCNRESNCGYHYTPKQYYDDNQIEFAPIKLDKIELALPKIKPTYIPNSFLEKSLSRKEANHFIAYLRSLFKDEITNNLIEKFKIAPSTHWHGATIFWQIDEEMRVRTGKIMLYNHLTGKRVKEPKNHINWVHSLAKLNDFNLQQCFYGLHQINDNLDKPVAIVESEKTAILLTVIYPKMIWLASGGISLSIQNFEPLKNRKIILYPDVGLSNKGQTPYEKWLDKAETLKLLGFDISVSTLIEKSATHEQRVNGYDLADYLVKKDNITGLALTESMYPLFWDF